MNNIWERKNLIIVLAVIALTCNTVFGQEKKDNTIIVHKSLKASQIVNTLFDNGYVIEKSDSAFISTQIRLVKGFHFQLIVSIRDSSVILKGLDQMTFMGTTDLLPVSNNGMKNSPNKILWNEMDRIAKLLGDSISYAKQ